MKKKILSLLLATVLILSSIPFSVVNAVSDTDYTEPTIFVEKTYAAAGTSVDVNLYLVNNPGVAGARITVSYNSKLTLTGASSGETFADLDYTNPGKFVSPCNFNWDSENAEVTEDGILLTLTFDVSSDAEAYEELNVDISYTYGDIYNKDLDSLDFDVDGGIISVINFIPGDVNDDGTVNGKDVTLVRRFNAGGYDISINEDAANVNDDGTVNGKDVTILRRYIAGGYDVKPIPPTPRCNHAMTVTAAKAETCTEDGNIAYWYCSKCEKYFSDEEGTEEVTLEETVVKATGHTAVIDEAVAPTYKTTGLTEGSHCSICGVVIKAQEIIPVLEGYSITYNVSNGDTYIASLAIENPNAELYSSYTPEDETIVLKNLQSPAGYKFLGWYDGEGDNATKITQIPKGSARAWELYAHWQKEEYTVSFASDMVPVESIKYTTDKKTALPTPKLDKYLFVGWTDDEKNVWTEISIGTSGDMTLYANWASYRNKATAVKDLDDPIIVEDTDNGLILFTYEIGTIENVPLFTVLNLQCVDGIVTTHSRTEEISISEENAKTIASTISNSTTNSAAWSLSKDWNDTVELSESNFNSTELTKEEFEELSQNSSGEYYVGNSYGGSNMNTTNATGSFKFSHNNSHSDTTTTERNQGVDLSVDAKASTEISGGFDVGFDLGVKKNYEIGIGADYHQSQKTINTGTDSWSNDTEMALETSRTKTNEKNWNTSSGYSISNSTDVTQSVANTVSNIISQETGYGKSYSEGGSNSESKELASTDSKSDEFSSTVAYHTSEIATTTTSFESTGNTTGDYRLVMAGDIHVFAVVGYDVASKTYFVNTYNVLDDKTEEYLDYSYDGTFNDYETSIIPFKVPVFVNDYVNSRIAMTDGLRVDPDTGIVDKSSAVSNEELGTVIAVPSYIAMETGDSTGWKSIKVTGISSDLFRGNTEVVGVVLGHHITEIPDNAFEGCTSLKYVICPGVTKIGNNAFSGCTSLNQFTIPTEISSIGTNAFTGVPKINATVSSASVAQAVAASGANKIILDISEIPADKAENLALEVGNVTYFEVQGKDKQYKNFSLKSDAITTVINGVKIIDGTGVSIKTSSENLTLNRVSVDSDGYAMLLTNDKTSITVNGNINLSSESGNTVVCKNISLSPLSASVVGKMNITGNMLVCGTIEGEEYLSCDNIVYITDEEFSQHEKGMITISFDANGGSVSETTVTTYFGKTVGTLPVPTRTNYTFVGWFTEASGGTEVTSDTILSEVKDITLYAHWSLITYNVYFNANGGSVGTASKTVDTNGTYGSLPTPSRGGYQFAGWYTAASGGTQITESTAVNLSGDQTLYAHWSQYALYFNANGGSGGPGTQYGYGATTISSATPYRTNYDFLGWSTSSSASSPSYYAGGSIGLYGTTTLYAVWKLKTVSMPSYIGWYYTDAQTNLQNLGLNVTFNYAYNYNYAYGVVYAQNYGQGTTLNAGTTVTLTYSLGPKPFAVGDTVEFAGGATYTSVSGSLSGYKWRDASIVYITDIYGDYCGIKYIKTSSSRICYVHKDLLYQKTN